jgi:hypothetical protein
MDFLPLLAGRFLDIQMTQNRKINITMALPIQTSVRCSIVTLTRNYRPLRLYLVIKPIRGNLSYSCADLEGRHTIEVSENRSFGSAPAFYPVMLKKHNLYLLKIFTL